MIELFSYEKGANLFMKCLFTEVQVQKLLKYQDTILFKYCCITDLYMSIRPPQVQQELEI